MKYFLIKIILVKNLQQPLIYVHFVAVLLLDLYQEMKCIAFDVQFLYCYHIDESKDKEHTY